MKIIKTLAIVAAMSVTCIIMAQENEMDQRENFRFGFKAGLNYSNIYNSNTDGFSADAIFGSVSGVVIHIPINKYLGVQPEFLFSQKGFKGKGTMFGWDYNFSRISSFLDFPLQIALKPSEFITVVAGPQYSYLLSQKDVFTSTPYSHSQKEVFDNDNIRRSILGFVAGMDVNIMYLTVGARMGWDMMNNKGDGPSSTPKYKFVWIQGTIGYSF